MARSVRSRRQPAKATSTHAESDDSGDDTETEEWNEHSANTGKASSSRLSGKPSAKRPIRTEGGDKENVGDVHTPNGAGGSSGSGGKTAVGLKRTETVGKFNDDEAEKRLRRKSAKLLGRQSTAFDGLTDPMPGVNGLQPVQLNSIVPAAPIINVPRDVMNSNFEEWMKMATDNKINANNSWNFALIDYFHDMSLLRNNTDNSINFQRASCTLDGCVKIWTSRVDSVNDETNKLLRGVRDGPGGGDSENDEDQDGADGAPGSQRTQRKGTHRAEATLAKTAAQLRSKKLDLEFSVDPLFKKTCADFDEGGAHGLLMNHLSLGVGIDGEGLRVVFDASDAVAKSGDDEEADEVEPIDTVDLSELRAQFLPNIEQLGYRSIAPSLRDFSFSNSNFSFDDDQGQNSLYQDDTFASPQQDFEDDDDVGGDDPIGYAQESAGGEAPFDGGDTQEPAEVQDFFSGDQLNQEGYTGDGDFGGDDDFGGDGDNGSVGADADQHAEGGAAGQGRGTFVPFDPARGPNERDLIMAMMDPDAEGGTMDYFDKNVLQNWAGPEHWKLRKVIRKPTGDQGTAAVPKQKREKKEAFKINFDEPLGMSVTEFAKEKFAPPPRGGGINLPGYALPSTSKTGKKGSKKGKEKEKEKREEQVLPDDMHFSSRQMVTLFLKPDFSLKMRGRPINPKTNAEGEIDENFWAQAAADHAAGRSGEDGNENGDEQAIPFNTQFFHDDFDDDGAGFDDGDDGGGIGSAVPGVEGDEPDLMATLAGSSRRIRPQYVNYTKKAKRVDVRKLKENIWRSLDIKISKQDDADESMDVDDGEEGGSTDPSEHRVFDSVVSNLRKTYPKDKMQDISTSFCFICLLHLANERGLKIEAGESPGAEGEGQPEEGDNRVGDLWGLKVSRDPIAITL